MSTELLEKMKENVIQGRKTRDDVGIDESLTGTPGVVELIEEALKEEIPANDIIGTARGRQAGSAARLTYRIRLPDSAGGHVLDVVDWMYLAPGGAIVNRSQFRKFGFKVAELVAVMRPEEADRMAA